MTIKPQLKFPLEHTIRYGMGLAMESAYWLGFGLSLSAAVIHGWLGGRESLGPVCRAPLRSLVRGTVEVVWHVITWQLLLLAAGSCCSRSRGPTLQRSSAGLLRCTAAATRSCS